MAARGCDLERASCCDLTPNVAKVGYGLWITGGQDLVRVERLRHDLGAPLQNVDRVTQAVHRHNLDATHEPGLRGVD